MESNSPTWQERFGLTTCTAEEVASVIPAQALGVAVVYESANSGEKVFLVIDSRAKSLREQCVKRLETAKLPPLNALTVAFKEEPLADATPEALSAACRQQIYLAGELRRELRPAMR